MTRILSGCRKCRQIGEKLCTKTTRCALERRGTTPGQHGKRHVEGKGSEYGRQLREKQKVRLLYGVAEKQFKRLFALASKQKGVTGENILVLMERRLDNTLFRLKLATTRTQARQMIVHGHVSVNGKRVRTPSYLVSPGEVVSLSETVRSRETFMQNVVEKRLNIAIKVPDWLELSKANYSGTVLRAPQRDDIQTPIQEHLIVELYSK